MSELSRNVLDAYDHGVDFNLPKSYAILSEDNPVRESVLQPGALVRILKSLNVRHWEIVGCYGGKTETSRLVDLDSGPDGVERHKLPDRLHTLARMLGQESILYSHQGYNVLAYCDGRDSVSGKGYELRVCRPNDNWTRLPNGLYLQCNLDF